MVNGISTAKAKSWSNSPWIFPVPVTDPVWFIPLGIFPIAHSKVVFAVSLLGI